MAAPQEAGNFRAVIVPTENSHVYLDPSKGFRETNFDGTGYLYLPWQEMAMLNFNLIQQIKSSGQNFDRIIPLSRGGLTMARDLADGLSIDAVSPVRYKRYRGVNQASAPTLEEGFARGVRNKIRGNRVLVVDEVLDEGTTMAEALSFIGRARPLSMTVASIAYKPRSIVTPDFHALETTDWIVFPHENREFIEGEAQKWREKGIELSDVRNRFLEIGIPEWQVDEYLNDFWNNSPEATV